MPPDEKPVERPVLLSSSHVDRALADPNFYIAMPEFSPVRPRAEAASSGVGCGTCRKRRARAASSQEFVRIMNTLPDSGMARLKRYFGFGRMLVRSVDPSNGMLRYREV